MTISGAVRSACRFITHKVYYLVASNIEFSMDSLNVVLEGQTSAVLSAEGVSQTADIQHGIIGCDRQALQLFVRTLEVRQAKEQQTGALSVDIHLKVRMPALFGIKCVEFH